MLVSFVFLILLGFMVLLMVFLIVFMYFISMLDAIAPAHFLTCRIYRTTYCLNIGEVCSCLIHPSCSFASISSVEIRSGSNYIRFMFTKGYKIYKITSVKEP